MGNAATCGSCHKSEIMRTELSIENHQQPTEEFGYPNERNEQFIDDNEQYIEDNDHSTRDIIRNEIDTGHKYVSLNISYKIMKSICKIIIKKKENEPFYGTGFFMKISNSLKFLFTNYHVINRNLINDSIEIEIWNNEKMNLNLNQHFIKDFKAPKDVTIIEIKEEDKIFKDIIFLDYDSNYKEKGYSIYKNADVFTLSHPFGGDVSCSSGRILSIYNYEFSHDISTDNGSSGCPIILLNNNINLIQVIGIHKCANISRDINRGTFIGEIINEVKSSYYFPEIIKNKIEKEKEERENEERQEEDLTKKKEMNLREIQEDKSNVIIATIYIKKEEVNKFIKIINSHENYMEYNDKKSLQKCKNDKEIRECEIRVNNELIKFNYLHAFKNEGIYTIKYTFKNLLTKTNNLFSDCSYLISIDLSHFNTENVKNMHSMFYGCSSLKNIDLSNFNTQNVIDMNSMFYGCSSLISLDLSKFNTQKVMDINSMFYGCSALKNIDLSKFNTQNVKNICKMFYGCSSLKNIDLSNFNTQNITDMNSLFYGCSSLININLSKFNTQNVKNMCKMLFGCSSLKDIDLSNFNTQNVTDMSSMFHGCSSLKIIDLSKFNTQNVKNICKMFSGCSSLDSINLYEFNNAIFSRIHNDIKKELSCMFNGCTSLKRNNIEIKDHKIREIIKKWSN